MDDTRKHSAFAAANEAHAHLASAQKHLIGQRLPLAGMHRDLEKAAADLSARAGKSRKLCRPSRPPGFKCLLA